MGCRDVKFARASLPSLAGLRVHPGEVVGFIRGDVRRLSTLPACSDAADGVLELLRLTSQRLEGLCTDRLPDHI